MLQHASNLLSTSLIGKTGWLTSAPSCQASARCKGKLKQDSCACLLFLGAAVLHRASTVSTTCRKVGLDCSRGSKARLPGAHCWQGSAGLYGAADARQQGLPQVADTQLAPKYLALFQCQTKALGHAPLSRRRRLVKAADAGQLVARTASTATHSAACTAFIEGDSVTQPGHKGNCAVARSAGPA